ncbi:MAG TPA: four helix bundle protein [Calditrichia bacterium]|nr:four helix bundle protein [Calditrichia bacterium]
MAYQLAYRLAMDVFEKSKAFPRAEAFSMTDQIRRASRSVCANLAEGYRKRQYPKHFLSKLSNADAEASEVLVFLDFARDCGYLNEDSHKTLMADYQRLGQMLGMMMQNPRKFFPK